MQTVEAFLQKLQESLIEGDVSVELVEKVIARIRRENEKAKSSNVAKERCIKQRLQKLLFHELVGLISGGGSGTENVNAKESGLSTAAAVTRLLLDGGAASTAGPGLSSAFDVTGMTTGRRRRGQMRRAPPTVTQTHTHTNPRGGDGSSQAPQPNARSRTQRVIMMVGLQGAGKTTTTTKLAFFLKKRGLRCGVVCCDTFRAGAYDQLKQNCSKIRVPFYGSADSLDSVDIAARGLEHFSPPATLTTRCPNPTIPQHDGVSQNKGNNKGSGSVVDVILVDTAGRHKQEASLFEEMDAIKRVTNPTHTIYVVDSHIGQACALQARAFREAMPIGSVIVTKLDGHAKGGGAIAAVVATGAPVSFVGLGEAFDELEPFNATSFVSRLMGLGDPNQLQQILLEHSGEGGEGGAGRAKTAAKVKRMLKGGFTYSDFLSQISMMNSLGGMGGLLSMIPGMGGFKMTGEAKDSSELQMKRFKAIIDSMTPAERDCQEPIADSPERLNRLARGSGCAPAYVKALIQQKEMMAKMIQKMGGSMMGGSMMGAQGRGVNQGPGMNASARALKAAGLKAVPKKMTAREQARAAAQQPQSPGGMPDLAQLLSNMMLPKS